MSCELQSEYDVIVIGATASGTAAAVSAARLGVHVLLTEESNRPGGMCSNGLSVTDMRSIEHSTGFFDEFRRKVAAYCGEGDGLRYEPKVADRVMKSIIQAERNLVFRPRRRAMDVRRTARGWELTIEDSTTGYAATAHCKVLIDATVEADIAAMAGVRFRIPREARTDEEPHAGVIYYDNTTDESLPGSTGEADHRLQSYAYLLTVKDYGPNEDRTIPEPPDYDPDNYKNTPPWEESWAYLYAQLPNGKFELNQHPSGTDLPGVNYGYPQASHEERARIAELYRNRALGYLYYLQTELGKRSISLADDEYPDTENFPEVLYVREARRMVGLAFMQESDVTASLARDVPDCIAIGDYPMDSHATQPPEVPNARHRGEGEFWLVRQTPPYRVPLGIILPEGVPDLIVPTAVSASHVAYGTLRMEPVRMSMGQAAGALAASAVTDDVEPSEVPYRALRELLKFD